MQSPGFFKEQALIRADRLLTTQHMIEGRNIRAFRMAALHRLIKLLRVSQKYETSARLRDRQHVCKAHLCSLIDE